MNKTNILFKVLSILTICIDALFVVYFVVCGALVLAQKIVFANTQFVVLIVALVINFAFLLYSIIMLKTHKK